MIEDDIALQLFPIYAIIPKVILVLLELFNFDSVVIIGEVAWPEDIRVKWKIFLKLRFTSVTVIGYFRKRCPSSSTGDSFEEGVHIDLFPIITAVGRFLEHPFDELSQLNVHVLWVFYLIVQDFWQ